MARTYPPMLLFLAAVWGASYLFIKVAVEEMTPATTMTLRILFAAIVLGALLLVQQGWRRARSQVLSTGRHGIVLGLINMVVPFWLIAWGEQYIDSGIAAIGIAAVPIFVVLLAIRLRPSERATGLRLLGIVIGLIGIGVLVGVQPGGGWWAIAGTLAVVLASLFYARSNLYAQAHFADVSPLVTATSSTIAGALILLPFGLARMPSEVPSWKALGSVAALGVVGTAIATIVLYRMISTFGSSRTSLVAYLIPVFALAYGAILLDERITAGALIGLALILAGVALGSGVLRSLRARDRAPLPAAQGS